MAILDRGGRGYVRRGYSRAGGYGRAADSAILSESAREAGKHESVAGAVIPGRLPIVPLRRQAPLILVMSGVLFVFAFTLVVQMANCTRAAKDISVINKAIHETRLDNEALKQEITELMSGERIAREAVFTLGMVEPPNTLRYVNPPDIPPMDEPQTEQALAESWFTTALRALGGVN